MRCPSCEATVDTSGVFPGARIACAGCGAQVQVGGAARRGRSSPQIDAPYRVASALPAEAPAAREAPPGEKKSGTVCPRCAASLDGALDRDGLLSCGDCGGVFVSHEELDAALDRQKKSATLDARAAAPLGAEEVRYLACPRCDDRMNRSLFG
jgi:Zn-finger nucleic acid-binding protein